MTLLNLQLHEVWLERGNEAKPVEVASSTRGNTSFRNISVQRQVYCIQGSARAAATLNHIVSETRSASTTCVHRH